MPRLAAAAYDAGRPLAVLAAGIAHLEAIQPKGWTRKTTLPLLAYTLVSGDWRSGRQCRPGRKDAALGIGRSEDSVREHWRRLEVAGLLVPTCPGKHRSSEEHDAELAEDAEAVVCRCKGEDVDGTRRLGPGERWCRRRDRSEWTAPMPAHITHEQASAYVEEAAAILLRLAGPFAPGLAAEVTDGILWPEDMSQMEPPPELVDEQEHQDQGDAVPPAPATSPVDKPAAHTGFSPPSPPTTCSRETLAKKISTYFPSSRKNTRPKTKEDGATRRQRPERGATRPGAVRRRGRPVDPLGLALGREIAADPRFPWLRRSTPVLATILTPYARNGWTTDDVYAAAKTFERRRLEKFGRGYTAPTASSLHHAEAYARAILAESGHTPEGERPTVEAARRAIEHRAQALAVAQARAEEAAARRQAAEVARDGSARAEAHAIAAEAARRRRR